MRTFSLLVVASILAGCAGPTYVWQRDGTEQAEYERDNAGCTNQAYVMNGANRAIPAHVYFKNCMIERGYGLSAVR